MQGGGAQRAVLGSLSVPALVFPGSDAGFRHLGRLVRVSGFGSRAGGGAGQPRDCIRPRNWSRRPGMRTGRTLPRRRDEARGNPSTLAGAGHAEKRAAPRHAPPPTPHTHTETPAGPHTGARARPRGGPRGAAGAGAARQPARRTLSCSTDARLLGSATKASRGAAVVEITSGSEPPPRCAMARGGRAGAEGRAGVAISRALRRSSVALRSSAVGCSCSWRSNHTSLRGGASRPSCCGAICAPWATGGAGAGARSHAGGAASGKRPPPRGIAIAGQRQRRLWRKRLPARCAPCAPGDQAGAQGTRKDHQTQA